MMDYPNPYAPYPGEPFPADTQGGTIPIIPVVQQYAAPVQNQPFDPVFVYPQNLPGALSLIGQAVAGESEDAQFYEWLLQRAPSPEDRQIITGIRNDELHHNGWFRQLYLELTGRPVPSMPGETFMPPPNYCDGLRRAIQGEQHAVQNYRKILFALQNRVHINVLTEIITDELRHAVLYNYLYAKNSCKA
ncbi:ferritin family protein [Ethanoligenens harbinense]|uniref:ferritin family protein n=1 Tax=Ethanoligenens harbinense TaxID=253239 RepID=UPI0010C071A8|nr:ferritin family protein [Ethanoligenens harbinense]QCN91729.1 rubrerythrin [Ethanoligenens harbinense]